MGGWEWAVSLVGWRGVGWAVAGGWVLDAFSLAISLSLLARSFRKTLHKLT